MNGEHAECPIVPYQTLKLNVEGFGELKVSAVCDTIRRYANGRYNHLLYLDEDKKQLVPLFLGSVSLSILSENGIPTTDVQPEVPQRIHEDWVDYEAQLEAQGLDDEIDHFFGNT